MWLARPIYEFLPYLYMVIGIAMLVASWVVRDGVWPYLLLIAGALGLIGGLVLWLRRRDYRTTQAQYDRHSLDD